MIADPDGQDDLAALKLPVFSTRPVTPAPGDRAVDQARDRALNDAGPCALPASDAKRAQRREGFRWRFSISDIFVVVTTICLALSPRSLFGEVEFAFFAGVMICVMTGTHVYAFWGRWSRVAYVTATVTYVFVILVTIIGLAVQFGGA